MSLPNVAGLFSDVEAEWLTKIQKEINVGHHHYLSEFNLLRWCYAYNGDIEAASKKCRRHIKIRQILSLDQIRSMGHKEGIDEKADHYAPMTYLGQAGDQDHRPVFLEKSGLFDLQAMMSQIRTTPFMMNRFRLMEQILAQIRTAEERTGKMSSAVLLVDLKGLSFQSNLVSFLTGTYRIMWGTLMEQYPFMFSKFIIVNAPTFMNVIWGACSSFIPQEYRSKVLLLNTNDNYQSLFEHVHPQFLPAEYGGHASHSIPTPIKCEVESISHPSEPLSHVKVPAGGSTVESYYLTKDTVLEFYIKHSQEFTMNIFFSPHQKEIKNINKEMEVMEEVFAGCERPALPTLDYWVWRVPYTGFYHVIYGNEKAWLMSVSVEYQMFEVHQNGHKIKVNPIKGDRLSGRA